MKFKTKTKDSQLVVKARASFGESINEMELDRFARKGLRGFLKPKVIKKTQAEYLGPIGVSLYERLKRPISKKDFLFILEHIVIAVQKLESNGFILDNMVMDTKYSYMNENTKEVQFLYVPMNVYKSTGTILDFIQSVIYSANPAMEKDMEYVSRFAYFLQSLHTNDVQKIENFIAKEDESVVNVVKKLNVGQSGYMTNKQKDYYEHYDEKEDPTSLLEEKPTGLLEENNPTGLLEEDNPTGLLEEDSTGLLEESDLDSDYYYKNFPVMYRVNTEEEVKINKPVFRFGRGASYVDYCITGNQVVGRSHADIIVRGMQYFVKDLGSLNRTFVNGVPIPSECETELFDGDSVKFANEEFIFRI